MTQEEQIRLYLSLIHILTYGNHKNHAASCRQGPHRKSGDQ